MFQLVDRGRWALVVVALMVTQIQAADDRAVLPADSAAAVERSREMVRMLDDLYKTNIVLITENFVEDENSYPAGSAAIELFAAMKQKGWHDIRLLDVTGKPVNEDNVAQDRFEREAILQLKKPGASYYEQIETQDGQRMLRAATPVPVVMQKCILCHDHYAEAKAGEPIGIISYSLPIK